MGDGKPACSSKQAIHAFEDAYLLEAKVGLEGEMSLSLNLHSHTNTLASMHSQPSDNQDL